MLTADYPIQSTLNTPAVAQFGARVDNEVALSSVLEACDSLTGPVRWLGEGSNVVPMPEVPGCVVQLAMQGVEVLDQDVNHVWVRALAGNNWHEFVQTCLNAGWHGLENLALIPGTVGAVPVQNVGAYGVEVSQFVERVHVFDLDGNKRILSNEDCAFQYRDSRFKTQTELAITAVDFKLLRHAEPVADYPDIQRWFRAHPQQQLSPASLLKAVVEVRQQKLPAPDQCANVGSFFKNPVVSQSDVLLLQHSFGSLQTFPVEPGWVKLSAAQLIDLAGGKQLHKNSVRCWQKQPLVIVNPEGHTADVVLAFATKLQKLVEQTFSVSLQIEPQIWE